MNIFPVFQTILYTISTALLYPVVILLISLSVWLIIYTGGFIAEFVQRKKFCSTENLADALERIQAKHDLPPEIKHNLPIHITKYSEKLKKIVTENDLFVNEKIENLLQQNEHYLKKDLNKVQLIVRVGPSLGLMGTLIPMGTGLAGLTQGDMTQLSSSLILAFTTTVVGIGLGVTSYFFSVIKQEWLNKDCQCLALITEALTKNPEDQKTGQKARASI